MIITDAMLLARVEEFLAHTTMAQTRLGMEVLGDGALVKQLREGRSLSLRNAEKLCGFMDEFEARYDAEKAAAASQAAA